MFYFRDWICDTKVRHKDCIINVSFYHTFKVCAILHSGKTRKGSTNFIKVYGRTSINWANASHYRKQGPENAKILETEGYGYRPAIGFQYARLQGPVGGPSYGSSVNAFTDAIPLTPTKRFEKIYERCALGFIKVDAIIKPDDILAFNKNEAYGQMVSHYSQASAVIKVSA